MVERASKEAHLPSKAQIMECQTVFALGEGSNSLKLVSFRQWEDKAAL